MFSYPVHGDQAITPWCTDLDLQISEVLSQRVFFLNQLSTKISNMPMCIWDSPLNDVQSSPAALKKI